MANLIGNGRYLNSEHISAMESEDRGPEDYRIVIHLMGGQSIAFDYKRKEDRDNSFIEITKHL